MIRFGELALKLVVNSQVRREHEEIVDAVRQVQVTDESPHEPRFADAGGQGKTNGRKFALEIRHDRELGPNRIERCLRVRALSWRDKLRHAVKNLQRTPLRRTQAQSA